MLLLAVVASPLLASPAYALGTSGQASPGGASSGLVAHGGAGDQRAATLSGSARATQIERPDAPTKTQKQSGVVRAAKAVFGKIKRAGLQGGGIALGMGEKALGPISPDLGGEFKSTVVDRPTSSSRTSIVLRSNQPRSAGDIGHVVDLAARHGITDRSQIAMITLRAEKNEDAGLVKKYEAGVDGKSLIKVINLKSIDNTAPRFAIGAFRFNAGMKMVKTAYDAVAKYRLVDFHCNEGIGRTGVMVATAVRILHDGLSKEDALAEAKAHGLSMPFQRVFIARVADQFYAGKIPWASPPAAATKTESVSSLLPTHFASGVARCGASRVRRRCIVSRRDRRHEFPARRGDPRRRGDGAV